MMGEYADILGPMCQWSMQEFNKKVRRDRISELGVAKAIELIGEAAHNVSQSCRNRYPAIDFEKLAELRHTLVHAYGTVHINDLHSTLRQDIRKLWRELKAEGFIN